jgi:hypothetical protein
MTGIEISLGYVAHDVTRTLEVNPDHCVFRDYYSPCESCISRGKTPVEVCDDEWRANCSDCFRAGNCEFERAV